MRLFTRYILREVGQVFLVTLVALTALMVLFVAVKEALRQGLGAAQVAQILPYLLPSALIFAIPGTILFSVSSVYGRLSAGNEVVALKSLGVNPMAIIWPSLALATLLSFTTVWLNDIAMSWGMRGVQRVVIDALEDIAYSTLRTQRSFAGQSFSVTVRKVEGRRLISPVFSLPPSENSGAVTVRAEMAELRSNPGSGVLTILLYNGAVEAPGNYFGFPDKYFERDIAIQSQAGSDSPAQLALWEIPGAITKQRETIGTIKQEMVSQAGFQMLTADVDGLSGADWREKAKNLQYQQFRLFRMQTEPPRRWANGFTCVCFALVGSAMAIRMRNSDTLTSFFLCFGPILLVYYPLLAFGIDRAKAGAIHPYVVWLANFMLVVWGMWLLRRVQRY